MCPFVAQGSPVGTIQAVLSVDEGMVRGSSVAASGGLRTGTAGPGTGRLTRADGRAPTTPPERAAPVTGPRRTGGYPPLCHKRYRAAVTAVTSG
ncbi:hypothetical protein GCM10009549_01910 [Streptomyces thermoalcalitolerans]|uniref:Uncharacterized protein n=1 Tax=Streptomyces thermoalcalitolerans TaxID=65605 RepID=A0ABP3YP78_9ACTN